MLFPRNAAVAFSLFNTGPDMTLILILVTAPKVLLSRKSTIHLCHRGMERFSHHFESQMLQTDFERTVSTLYYEF